MAQDTIGNVQKKRLPYRAPHLEVILSHKDTANPWRGPGADPPTGPVPLSS